MVGTVTDPAPNPEFILAGLGIDPKIFLREGNRGMDGTVHTQSWEFTLLAQKHITG